VTVQYRCGPQGCTDSKSAATEPPEVRDFAGRRIPNSDPPTREFTDPPCPVAASGKTWYVAVNALAWQAGVVKPSASLFNTSVAIIKRARELCSTAKVVNSSAAELRAATRLRRQYRQDWKALWSACRADPQNVIHSCAYCHRVKEPSTGEWLAISPKVSESLTPNEPPLVSHGFCPDCIDMHAPEWAK